MGAIGRERDAAFAEGAAMAKRVRGPKISGGARPGAGRRKIAIELDPQKYEIAGFLALREEGYKPFDAARRALLAVRGGPFSVEDIEGLLRIASAEVPLPQPFNDWDPDKGLRRLVTKAERVAERPSGWLVLSVGTLQALIHFIREDNTAGMTASLDRLAEVGWTPIILGFTRRLVDALNSNLPPAAAERLNRLGPAAREQLTELRKKNSRFE
jgi:hypothetical protein